MTEGEKAMLGNESRGGSGETEAALESFFRAAREEAMEPPSAAFLNAVFADAAEISATRPAPAQSAPEPERAPGGAWRALGALLGGWRGGAALTACALAGFLLGASGSDRYSTGLLETAAANSVSAADALNDFYDLASLE